MYMEDMLPQLNNSEDIREKIYTIRGEQVMLDSDLAQIYGYETKNLNRQVRNNTSKFPEDFMFQLTQKEVNEISRCKNFTSIMQKKELKVVEPYFLVKNNIEKFDEEDFMFQLT